MKYKVRPDLPEDIKKKLKGNHPIAQKLLYHRGIDNSLDAEVFLNPSYERDISDPSLLKDMDKAVARLLLAISKDEKIAVYSDYDADGIPGGVILHDFFKAISFQNFRNYIPHRHDEGYGLNMEAIDELARDNVRLIITVDCGIADVAPAERCKNLGIDLIITDHHLPQEKLPDAYAILNPKQKDCQYPDKMLCGAGMAFKLVQGILQKERFGLKKGYEKWFLDMAGLSTIADMVPLVGENRAIAHFGLKVLRKSKRIGLKKLLRKNKIKQENLSEDDIGFMIAPRINAAGRMDTPEDAFRLLATTDEDEAEVLSEHLNKINNERKGVVASMVKEARHKEERFVGKKVIVLGNPNWRPALLGLVANSLVESMNRPVFIWGRDGGSVIKGSCRSDGSVSVVEMMTLSEGLFLEFGGHKFAGGFSVDHEKIHTLENELEKAYEKAIRESVDEENQADFYGSPSDININTWKEIEAFAPFGEGNPKPVFCFLNVLLNKVGTFGKENNHLTIEFAGEDNIKRKAIKFFAKSDDFGQKLKEGERVSLVGNIEKSEFGNFSEIRLRIVDIF